MNENLKTFATKAEYDTWIAGTYPEPNVSYIEATDEVEFTDYTLAVAPESLAKFIDVGDFEYTTFSNPSDYLTSIEVPEGVTEIGENAFKECDMLSDVSLPSTLTTISSSAFFACMSLEEIDIPENVTSIGYAAFFNCPLTEVDFPAALSEIGSTAFTATALTSIDLSGTAVTVLSTQAFSGCTSLASASLPSALTEIGLRAFDGCSALATIDIPSTVTSIKNYAFRDCTALTSVTVRATTPPVPPTYPFFTGCTLLEHIYVPAASVEDYKSVWSDYASIITAITE